MRTAAPSVCSLDPLDRRIRKVVSGSTSTDETFFYDGDRLAYVRDTGASSIKERYFNGPGTQNVFAVDTGSGTLWFLNDHQASVGRVARMDGDGLKTADFTYDAYGERTLVPDSDPSGDASLTPRIGFTGQIHDETGLIYFGRRYLDPSLGRFISQDPIRDGDNWYAFTGNNPINQVDVAGLAAFDSVVSSGVAVWNTLSGWGGGAEELAGWNDDLERPVFNPRRASRNSTFFNTFLPATASAIGSPPPEGFTEFARGSVSPLVKGTLAAAATSIAIIGAGTETAAGAAVMWAGRTLGTRIAGAALTANGIDNLQAIVRGQPTFVAQGVTNLTGSPVAGEIANVALGVAAGRVPAGGVSFASGGVARRTPAAIAELSPSTVNTVPKVVSWVDEPLTFARNSNAVDYSMGAPGARSNLVTQQPMVPQLSYQDSLGVTRNVRFDGLDAAGLIDRKVSVTMHAKTFDTVARQSWALRVNNMQGRWQVPNAYEARRAQKIFNAMRIDNLTVEIVP